MKYKNKQQRHYSLFKLVLSHFKVLKLNTMLRSTILVFCFTVTLFSCTDKKENEDITNTINKNGAVESSILVTPLNDSFDVLTTTHKVWVRDTIYKSIEYRDTVPALGTELKTAENSDGDKQTVPVKKEYEIFITVK